MTPAERSGAIKAANVLAKALPVEVTADLLNSLLCVAEDGNLEDWEFRYAKLVFDTLSAEKPEAVDIASEG